MHGAAVHVSNVLLIKIAKEKSHMLHLGGCVKFRRPCNKQWALFICKKFI